LYTSNRWFNIGELILNTRTRIFLSLAFITLLLTPIARATQFEDAISDLSTTAQEKVKLSVQGYLKLDVKPERSSNDLGWDCLAAASLIKHGVESAKGRISKIADRLLSDAVRDSHSGKIIGWTAKSPELSTCEIADAASTSKKPNCKGPKATFAFQTGLGIACLSLAGEAINQTNYIKAASDAMDYWKSLIQPIVPCEQCIYFSTSDSAKHDERYVRNMNLFMAYGAAELGRVSGSKEDTELSKKSVRSDIWERKNNNKGYLSRLDKLWQARASEADRIENHSAAVALLLFKLGSTLNEPHLLTKAEVVYKDWATCDNQRCEVSGCKYWAGNPSACQATSTATHCAFREVDELAKMNCEKFLQLVPRVNSYGIWSVLQARDMSQDKKISKINLD